MQYFERKPKGDSDARPQILTGRELLSHPPTEKEVEGQHCEAALEHDVEGQ